MPVMIGSIERSIPKDIYRSAMCIRIESLSSSLQYVIIVVLIPYFSCHRGAANITLVSSFRVHAHHSSFLGWIFVSTECWIQHRGQNYREMLRFSSAARARKLYSRDLNAMEIKKLIERKKRKNVVENWSNGCTYARDVPLADDQPVHG